MKDRLVICGTAELLERNASKATLPHTILFHDNHTLAVFAKQTRKKCKPKDGKQVLRLKWKNINELFPNSSLKYELTKVHITMDPLPASHTFIVVAHPKPTDQKRIILVAFLKQSPDDEDLYVVYVYLHDDIKTSFENFCKVKDDTGFLKLAPEQQFFLCYDPEKDVEISLENLDPDWKLEDNDTKTIQFESYWEAVKSKASCTFKLRRCSEEDYISFKINARHCSTQLTLSKYIEVSSPLRQRHYLKEIEEEMERKRKKAFVVRNIEADDEILDLVVQFLDSFDNPGSPHQLCPTAKSKKGKGEKKKVDDYNDKLP